MESNSNPQRKIVFNAPGVSMNSSSPKTQLPGEAKVNSNSIAPGLNKESSPAFRSFAHDIKSNVSNQGVSMAQIVMAEERRRQDTGTTSEDIQESDEKSKTLRIVLIIVGIIAILGGSVALFFTFRSAQPVNVNPTTEDYSPIRAQKIDEIELRDGYKNTFLEAIRGVAATRIQDDTFVELKLSEVIGTTSVPVGFKRLNEILNSNIPDTLARSTKNNYVIGVYSKGEINTPFIMFSADAFENAYVGMKNWEATILGDIGAIFMDQQQLAGLLTVSNSSLFQDKIYYNKDTRTVFGPDGKPIFVWAILDRTNIVITRDGETLNALIKRITLENIKR
jgi:hypothetical protein